MAGAGPPSTPALASSPQGVDDGRSATMTSAPTPKIFAVIAVRPSPLVGSAHKADVDQAPDR
jgi:hypothetical protein